METPEPHLCLYCGQPKSEKYGPLLYLPGFNPKAAPGWVHPLCGVLELAALRTLQYMEEHPVYALIQSLPMGPINHG